MEQYKEFISCKCGSIFAATLVEYIDDEWIKERDEYLSKGCSVTRGTQKVDFDTCKCHLESKQPSEPNVKGEVVDADTICQALGWTDYDNYKFNCEKGDVEPTLVVAVELALYYATTQCKEADQVKDEYELVEVENTCANCKHNTKDNLMCCECEWWHNWQPIKEEQGGKRNER